VKLSQYPNLSGMISLRRLQDVWIVLRRGTILCGTESGESKDVDGSVMSEHKPKLLELISPYEPKNIYNVQMQQVYYSSWILVLFTHSNCTTDNF
jgi:hypothetical protein